MRRPGGLSGDGLTGMRAALARLLSLYLLAGCTYGPPAYRGNIESAALLGDGRVAIGYSQLVSRQPTGINAFPDGGRQKILHDQFLVALVDRNGSTREIARYDNPALPGAGSIHVAAYGPDPGHIYVRLGGQLDTDLPLRRARDTHRIDLDGREAAKFDLGSELARQGRELGAKGFGSEQVVDSGGTIVAGATRDGVRELWRRDPGGRWALLDRFEKNASLVGDDLVYLLGDYQLARNWRSGAVRKLVYFNPATQESEVFNRNDPAHPTGDYRPTKSASVGSDGTIEIRSDNHLIASIKPDRSVLDRR